MEEKNVTGSEAKDISTLLKGAQSGDEKAMIQLLEIFSPQMEKHAKMLRMSKEDAMQSLKLELILFIQNFNSDSEDYGNIGTTVD